MAQLQIVYLLRPGTQERWRRLCQELAGTRLDQFEASCWQAGITQVHVQLVQLLHGELMLMTLHTQEPQQTLQELATSKRPFDRWLRVKFLLDNGNELRFSDTRKFGRVYLCSHIDEVLPDLGPEPLDDAFTLAVFRKRGWL